MKMSVLALVLAAVLVVLLLPSDGAAMQFDSSPVWVGISEPPLDLDEDDVAGWWKQLRDAFTFYSVIEASVPQWSGDRTK